MMVGWLLWVQVTYENVSHKYPSKVMPDDYEFTITTPRIQKATPELAQILDKKIRDLYKPHCKGTTCCQVASYEDIAQCLYYDADIVTRTTLSKLGENFISLWMESGQAHSDAISCSGALIDARTAQPITLKSLFENISEFQSIAARAYKQACGSEIFRLPLEEENWGTLVPEGLRLITSSCTSDKGTPVPFITIPYRDILPLMNPTYR
ncbi:MAG: hypothetical protein ACUVRD_07140 [Bacteroidia bacterium]